MRFRTDYERARQRLARRQPDGALGAFLRHPFPPGSADYRDVDYLAVDLETTGLDAARDDILSIGYVQVHGDRIRLGTATHMLIRPAGAVTADSVAIHGITDDQAARGVALAVALERFLAALAGKVLLAHHAVIETAFLSQACQRVYGSPLLVPTIDTVALQRRQSRRGLQRVAYDEDLRLDVARRHYGLPRHTSHDALSDAIGCGELFLAQSAALAGSQTLPLSRLWQPYASSSRFSRL